MSKPIWGIVLFILGLLALWRSSLVSFEIWEYVQLIEETTTQDVKWEIIPKGSKYTLQASYGYIFQGKAFKSKQLLGKPYHLNKSSAEGEIQKISGMSWTVWIDPKQPKHAKIEKNFPYRETAYAICLLILFIYFLGLRFHLELLKKSIN